MDLANGKGAFVDSTRRKAVRRCFVTIRNVVSGFSRFRLKRVARVIVITTPKETRDPRVSLTLMLISNVKRVFRFGRESISIQ